jgi:hypothetical protein
MKRSPKIKRQALKRANGQCEACGFDAEGAIEGMILTSAMGHLDGTAVTRARAIELLCEVRKWPVRKSLLEVDHKVPLALGGKDDLQNTRVLCLGCHRAKPDLKLIPKAVRKAKRRETFEARMAEKAGR